jgi:ERCC4-type nuclease
VTLILDTRTPNERQKVGSPRDYTDLYNYLLSMSVPAQLQRIEFCDAHFWGQGPGGLPVPIGAEIKRIGDVIACMQDGRFAGHQLPGIVATTQYRWLILEGPFKADDNGDVVMLRGRDWVIPGSHISHSAFQRWLISVEVTASFRVWRTFDRRETAKFLADLYGWWSKPYEEHDSHLALDYSDPYQQTVELIQIDKKDPRYWVREVAKNLPGIGRKRSLQVSDSFPSVRVMANAGPGDWERIDGIGHGTAVKVVQAITGERVEE